MTKFELQKEIGLTCFGRAMPILAAFAAVSLTVTPVLADVKAGVDAWDAGNYETAVGEWRQPALNGDADAQFNMGQAYKLGRGVKMNLGQAEQWFRRAAAQGHLRAEDNLGLIMFQQGQRADALPYIQASAARGEARAQYVLGTAHFNGDLVPRDWVRAYALMSQASTAGLPQASRSLSTMENYIPSDQRQQGIELASRLESEALQSQNQQLAVGTQGRSANEAPTSSRIGTADLPPSTPARQSQPSTNIAATAGAEFARPASRGTPPARVRTSPPVRTAQAQPVPETPAPVPDATRSGNWRVQLGAFSTQQKAQNLWVSLENRVSALAGLQPYLVKTTKLTKLQAGPFATRSEATRVCSSLSTVGQACFPTSK